MCSFFSSESFADLQTHTAFILTFPALSIGSRGACGLKSCLRVWKHRRMLSMGKYRRKPVRKQFAFDLPSSSRRIHQSSSALRWLRLLSAFSVGYLVFVALKALCYNEHLDDRWESLATPTRRRQFTSSKSTADARNIQPVCVPCTFSRKRLTCLALHLFAWTLISLDTFLIK